MTRDGDGPGTWAGAALAALGLDGGRIVEDTELSRVMSGGDPRDGAHLGRAPRRVPGFDLTFLAPKSVAVLHGLSSPAVAGAVRAGHDAALVGVLGYLERHAATVVRRDHRGDRQQVPGVGLVGAAFIHRLSRAGDPLLHTHLLVANLGLDEDGRWSALDARPLFGQARSVGLLYHAALRHELTGRLGLAWGPVRNGVAQLVGIDETVLRAFSQRRIQVEAALEARGFHSSRAARVAALATRPAATQPTMERPDGPELTARWRDRAAALGLSREQLEGLVRDRAAFDRPVGAPCALPAVADLLPELADRGQAFGRRDIVRAACERAADGAPVEAVERLADELIESGRVVQIAMFDGRGRKGVAEGRWATPDLVALQHRVRVDAGARLGLGWGSVPEAAVEAAFAARPTLAAVEMSTARAIARSGDGIELVIVPNGPSRSAVLDAARAAWEGAGLPVVGVAARERGAVELEATTGILSVSVAGLPPNQVPGRAVLVIDDAGRLKGPELAGLLDAAARVETKVVMVDAPTSMRPGPGLVAALASTVRAHEVGVSDPAHREGTHPEGAHREGVSAESLGPRVTVVERPGGERVLLGATAEDTRAALVADWWRIWTAGQSAVMVASRALDLEDLNRRATTLARTAGVDLPPRGPARTPWALRTTTDDRALVLGGDAVFPRGHDAGADRRSIQIDRYVVGPSRTGIDLGPRTDASRADRLETAAAGLSAPATARPRDGRERERDGGRSLAELDDERERVGQILVRDMPADPTPRLRALEAELAELARPAGTAGRGLGPLAVSAAGHHRYQERLVEERAELQALARAREVWLGEHGEALSRYAEVVRLSRDRRAALSRAAEAAPTAELRQLLGNPPAGLTERVAWRRGAGAIEAYRECWSVPGPEPVELRRLIHRRAVEREVGLAQRVLTPERTRERTQERGLERGRGLERAGGLELG